MYPVDKLWTRGGREEQLFYVMGRVQMRFADVRGPFEAVVVRAGKHPRITASSKRAVAEAVLARFGDRFEREVLCHGGLHTGSKRSAPSRPLTERRRASAFIADNDMLGAAMFTQKNTFLFSHLACHLYRGCPVPRVYRAGQR